MLDASSGLASQTDMLRGEVEAFVQSIGAGESRRRFERISCRVPARIPVNGDQVAVTILDIGAGGAQLDTPIDLPLGSRLDLSIDGAGGPLATRIARHGKAGVVLLFPQDDASQGAITRVIASLKAAPAGPMAHPMARPVAA